MAEVVRKGDRIEIGETVRIEQGPALRRRLATAEALSNAATASHYQVGGRDAKGQVIEEGKMFSYLDYLAPPVHYVFKRRAIGPEDPRYQQRPDGTTPPLDEGSTNINGYTYVFDEVDNFANEDEAIEKGQQLAAAGE